MSLPKTDTEFIKWLQLYKDAGGVVPVLRVPIDERVPLAIAGIDQLRALYIIHEAIHVGNIVAGSGRVDKDLLVSNKYYGTWDLPSERAAACWDSLWSATCEHIRNSREMLSIVGFT